LRRETVKYVEPTNGVVPMPSATFQLLLNLDQGFSIEIHFSNSTSTFMDLPVWKKLDVFALRLFIQSDAAP